MFYRQGFVFLLTKNQHFEVLVAVAVVHRDQPALHLRAVGY